MVVLFCGEINSPGERAPVRALADGRFNDDFCFLAGYIPEGGDLLPAFLRNSGLFFSGPLVIFNFWRRSRHSKNCVKICHESTKTPNPH